MPASLFSMQCEAVADKAARMACVAGSLESRSSSTPGLLGDLGPSRGGFIEDTGRMCLPCLTVVRTEMQVLHPPQVLLFSEMKTFPWAACRGSLADLLPSAWKA